MTPWALMAALFLVPCAVSAQPRLIPASDVQVTYRVDGEAAAQIPGGASQGVHLEWDAGGQRLKADPVGGPVYAIVDLSRRLADVVFPAQKSVLELPLRKGNPQEVLQGPDMQFTRRGNSRVLGLECAEWTVHSRRMDGSGCVTPDGVVLRAEGEFDGRRGTVQAVSLSRGRIPPGDFALPEGFFRLPLMGSR